ncbi:unnamed protein product [Phytophthora lilii]|uniref:Protein transport protein sec16 n=1 Tax=Phytophthora lilii TaxID=2077276 RepID=A0A9W6U2A9_9STRA|nr:unnamed protein product [Phytophthora lilii]
MTTRPASASGGPTSSSSAASTGWRPPPIGGLGSQRATPPPPPPVVGALSVAGVNRSATTTSVTSETTSVSSGLSVAAPAASSVATAAVNRSKPTQLFSMEDAEELYSDDGWDCDSPSTVLSNPTEEAESQSTTTTITTTTTTTTAAPVLAAAAEAAVEAPDDEFAWGDDEDAFASPVAKTAEPPTQPPPAPLETPSAAAEHAFASVAPAASAFETKVQTVMPPQPAAAPVAVPSSSFSASSTSSAFEVTSFNATQIPPRETKSPLEHAPVEATQMPPPAAIPSTSFSVESAHSTLEAKEFIASQVPPQAAHTQSSVSGELQQENEQWDDDWDQQEKSEVAGESTKIVASTITSVTTVTSSATANVQTDSFANPPVELTSPGGAAGEFWGEGDEEELFDHDDHADEEWDESIKGQTNSFQSLSLNSSGKTTTEPVPAPFPIQDTLSSPPPPPFAPVVETLAKNEEYFPEPTQTEEIKVSNPEKLVDQSQLTSESITATATSESNAPLPLQAEEPAGGLYAIENSQETKPVTSLDAGSSPFSSATAQSTSQDNDPNVFPEAPRSARFLHTPTGTGGPFGRVPSPQGDGNRSFQDDLSSDTVSATHDTEQTTHSIMTFEGGEKNDTYTESSVRWDAGSIHHSGHGHLEANQHEDEGHHNTRQGHSDEEERDSVVSFSGENSFFPSAGRPSSLYGGSQSSFASHRMYQSSVASTDHEGSSIASFGVSSAGATFGGSERVSEGGAFSDGTMSETPSIVDSSNASTAFGTDFPSVSEGQFSAPGTTIGGSDNASDGGFSDGNASETTSMCESVNTNPRFVSEFNSSSGHYATETAERRDGQEPFASTNPGSVTAFDSEPRAAAAMFEGGDDDSSADANPFANASSAFPPSQHVATADTPTVSGFDHPSSTAAQDEGVQSAASLFGATAGDDVPNPFSSFRASPAAPTMGAKPIDEHELPTSDAGDLFGSGPPASRFENSFAQPVQHSYSSSYQTHEQVRYIDRWLNVCFMTNCILWITCQSYNQAGRGGYSDSSSSAFDSTPSEVASSSPFDQPAGSVSSSSLFTNQTPSTSNSADPFASQHNYGSQTPSADSVFSGGGYTGSSSANHNASSHFGGSEQASASAAFGGGYQQTSNNSTTAVNQFGHQANAHAHSASYGGNPSYNQYGQSAATTYSEQSSASASTTHEHFRHQSSASVDAAASSTFGRQESYGQSSDMGTGVSSSNTAASERFGQFSQQSSANSFASGQNRYGNQQLGERSTPGTPDNFSRQSAAEAFASPAQPSYDSQRNSYSSQQFGQRSTPGTPDNYSHHSAAEVFGNASPAQPSYGGQQDYSHRQYGRSASGGFGDHTRSSSSASTDAFFGRSSADFSGERVTAASSGSAYHQSSVQYHAPPSFSRSGSNASSYTEQRSTHIGASAAPSHSSAQSHDLNTSFGSIEDTSFPRYASSSSMNRYGSDTSLQPQRTLHQHQENISRQPPVDANSFFGGGSSVTTAVTASSFFGNTASREPSELQASPPQQIDDFSISREQAVPQFSSPPQQENEQQQLYSTGDSTPHESRNEYVGASPVPAEATPKAEGEPATRANEVAATPSEILQHHESSMAAGLQPVPAEMDATGDAPEIVDPSFASESDANHPQAFDGFAESGPQEFGGHASPDFFSSSSAAPPVTAALQPHEEHLQENYEEEQANNDAAASLQFADTPSPFDQSNTASYNEGSAHATNPSSYINSGVPGAGSASPAGYAQQLQSQHQVQQPQPHQYQQYEQPQQRQQSSHQPHATGAYGYQGVAQSQPQATGYNTTSQHEYGRFTGHGYGTTSTHQTSHSAAVPAVKTSNKYKDPCVAPPSCLASFGFGGNVVTMFPKRKLRLNIAGTGYRNSPRGVSAYVLPKELLYVVTHPDCGYCYSSLHRPSEFENGGNGELRKGPVNVYRMDQLHPRDKEFEQMNMFPGPLMEDVSDEAILEYLDDRLKRSEAPTSVEEVEDENDRLLLGVLRVLVKCNGKLRSDPGTLNPGDPDSPEAQLITLLSESSRRRSGNQPLAFPALRKIKAVTHPDLILKQSNELRELLLVGDRKGAVAAAMTSHMWPEAMLIASFTDKEEYRVRFNYIKHTSDVRVSFTNLLTIFFILNAQRVLRTYLDETYATGDPCRALFMSFADQQEKSVQEPKKLLQTNVQQPAESLLLSGWVSHAQVLLANRTADTNKILTELGDRLWNEVDAVAAAHVCYLLAGIQVEAPMPSSKMALLGGDHRTPKEARFYVSPAAVQRTEVYEWAQKHSKGPAANLMIPFQGYKLIYAMLLADHGKLETAFKYVTSMLTVIKAVTATMKPGTSMYLEGMKNQLTVLDDRLRQHLGQDRIASVAASTSRGGGRKQGKWGLGSALSIMGKIVNRVVEGGDSSAAAPAGPSATTPGDLYANEATPPAASYPSTPSITASSSSPAPSYPQQHVQQTPPTSSHGPSPVPSYPQQHVQQTPPTSSHGPSPVPAASYGHATPPISQGSAPGSSNGYNRTSAAPSYSRSGANGIPPSGPFSGNGRLGPQHQQSGPFSGNGKPAPSGPYSNSGPASRGHGAVPLMRSQHSMEPPGSNHSNHSSSSFNGMLANSTPQYPKQQQQQQQQQQQEQQQQQQPPPSQTSQHSQYSQHAQDVPAARPSPRALQRPAPLDVSGDASAASQPKTLASGLAAEVTASLPPTNVDATTMSGPSSDKGKASPKFKSVKKPARSKTPPPSGSSKSSGWLSGLSSFIATKMNPEAKVAKLGEQMEAYYDEKTKRWVFPGETAAEELAIPSAPPTGPLPGSAPGSSATGAPPAGTNSAPGSISSGPAASNDPLAALMAPPPSHMLMKKDPLAAMMAPPSRPMYGGARRGGSTAQRKPPRPQFAVFKPTAAPAAPAPAPDEQGE